MNFLKTVAFFVLCVGVCYVQSLFCPKSVVGSSGDELSEDGSFLSDDSDDEEGTVWGQLNFFDNPDIVLMPGIDIETKPIVDSTDTVIAILVKIDDLVGGKVRFKDTRFIQNIDGDVKPEGAIEILGGIDNSTIIGWFVSSEL